MVLARVVGNVVVERKTEWIDAPVFLLVAPVNRAGKRVGSPLVALDPLGAKQGELVMLTQGSSCRQTEGTKDRPVDALVAGIVDLAEHDGRYTYKKDEGFLAEANP